MDNRDEIETKLKELKNDDESIRRLAAERLGELRDVKAISGLIDAMYDADTAVREAVGDALVAIGGEPVIKRLTEPLRSENEPARNLACEVLEAIGNQDLDLILVLMEDANEDVRKFAADVIGHIKNKEALPILINSLNDASPNVVTSVIESLGKLADEDAAMPLVNLLTGNFAFKAAVALGMIRSSKALPALLDMARDKANLARFAAIEAIGNIGNKSAIEELVKLISEEDVLIQKVVLKAIGMMDELWLEEHVVDFRTLWKEECFMSALDDSDDDLKRYAILALGVLNLPQGPKRLLDLLEQENEVLLPFIIHSLVRIGKKDLQAIMDGITRESYHVKRHMCVVLGDVQKNDVIPALMTAAKDENPLVRAAAVHSLGKYEDEKIFDVLKTALTDEDDYVRKSSADGLGWLGDAKAIDPLITLLEDPSKDAGESALGSLLMIGGPAVKTNLLKAPSHHKKEVRAYAMYGLGIINGGDVFDLLRAGLNDEDSEVRKTAVEALGKIAPSHDSIQALKLGFGDSDPKVRSAVLQSLLKLGAEDAVDIYKVALRDPDQWVRFKGVKCLASLKTPQARSALEEILNEADDLLRSAIEDSLK